MKEPGLLMVLALLHAPIHRSAWNKNSQKFACTEFSEVRIHRILRTSPLALSRKFGRYLGALKHILRWSTYSLLIKEYAAFVT